jgi:predicted nucleic acid-binding protein
VTRAETLVIDASVAIKWVVAEGYSSAALRLLDIEARCLVPPHFWMEVTSALHKKVRLRELSRDQAFAALAALTGAPLDSADAPLLPVRALDLALMLGHPVYDTAYLALAIAERARLVTADATLCDRAVATGFGEHVLWIEDVA